MEKIYATIQKPAALHSKLFSYSLALPCPIPCLRAHYSSLIFIHKTLKLSYLRSHFFSSLNLSFSKLIILIWLPCHGATSSLLASARILTPTTTTKVDSDKHKKALLLHYVGEEVFDIFETLPNHETSNFDEAIKLLTDNFCPKKSKEFEIHRFQKAKQMEDEFHTRLGKITVSITMIRKLGTKSFKIAARIG